MRQGNGQSQTCQLQARTWAGRIQPGLRGDGGQRQDRIRGCLERLFRDREVAAQVAQGLRGPVDADRVPVPGGAVPAALRGLTFLHSEDGGIRFWR